MTVEPAIPIKGKALTPSSLPADLEHAQLAWRLTWAQTAEDSRQASSVGRFHNNSVDVLYQIEP
jgi:hypothetical protein